MAKRSITVQRGRLSPDRDIRHSRLIDVCESLSGEYGSATNALLTLAEASPVFKIALSRLRGEEKKRKR